MTPVTVFDPKDPYKVLTQMTVQEEVAPTPAFPYVSHSCSISVYTQLRYRYFQTKGLMLGQWRLQLFLRREIERLGGTVELGTALMPGGIEQDDDGVTVKLQKIAGQEVTSEENARFKFVVGSDGAHSEF